LEALLRVEKVLWIRLKALLRVTKAGIRLNG
jgi:hypothetical protein